MSTPKIEQRRLAIDKAIGNNALSGYKPSDYGYSVFEHWIEGQLTTDEAVAWIMKHYRENPCSDSDSAANKNTMGLTDTRQLRMAEADITTLRLAQLVLEATLTASFVKVRYRAALLR